MNVATPWLAPSPRKTEPRIRLICLPYAGGNASIYHEWSRSISQDIEVCPVELPGHGARLGEPLRTSLLGVVDELAEALKPLFHRPYAILGHSLGALIAYHVASSLEGSSSQPPTRVFLMGIRPPDLLISGPVRHRLPDSALIEELRAFGGTPDAVLNHPEMMQFLIPIIRADLEMIETSPPTGLRPLTCGVSAFAGRSDQEASPEEMEHWRSYTKADFVLRSYSGNHFFPWSCLQAVIRDIESDLC